jgi:hypothetical protein
MAAGVERAGVGTTRRTFLMAGGGVLLTAIAGGLWSRRAGRRAGPGDARPRRAENLLEEAERGELVLRPAPLDPAGPVFHLNRSAAVVWRAVDGRRSVRDIAGVLAARYGLQGAAAGNDALSCLRTLAAQGLVTGVPATNGQAPAGRS